MNAGDYVYDPNATGEERDIGIIREILSYTNGKRLRVFWFSAKESYLENATNLAVVSGWALVAIASQLSLSLTDPSTTH